MEPRLFYQQENRPGVKCSRNTQVAKPRNDTAHQHSHGGNFGCGVTRNPTCPQAHNQYCGPGAGEDQNSQCEEIVGDEKTTRSSHRAEQGKCADATDSSRLILAIGTLPIDTDCGTAQG